MNIRFQFLKLICLVMPTIFQPALAETKSPISDSRLNQCYKAHPFLMESLVLISDEDFANQSKSTQRKILIKKEFEKDPSEVRGCVDDIIQYAKDQKDPENLKYVISRLKEVTSVVYSTTTTKINGSAGVK